MDEFTDRVEGEGEETYSLRQMLYNWFQVLPKRFNKSFGFSKLGNQSIVLLLQLILILR